MGKRAKPEEIIANLREVEVRLSQGETIGYAVRAIGVSEQSYYRWRKEYGGLQVDQAKRMKEMEKENTRLRRAVSDLTLDNQILQEFVRGKCSGCNRLSRLLFALTPFTQTPCDRSCGGRAGRVRAPGLPRDRSASLHAAQGQNTSW